MQVQLSAAAHGLSRLVPRSLDREVERRGEGAKDYNALPSFLPAFALKIKS